MWVPFCELPGRAAPARTDDVDVREFEWHYWRRVAKAFGILGTHNSPVRCVGFSPNGKLLAGGGDDGTVKVWDVGTAQETLSFKGHKSAVYSVCFSPDGKRIVSGSLDTTAKVWDAETGQEKLTLKGHAQQVHSVCFSPDGKQIVCAGGARFSKVVGRRDGSERSSRSKGIPKACTACASAPTASRSPAVVTTGRRKFGTP